MKATYIHTFFICLESFIYFGAISDWLWGWGLGGGLFFKQIDREVYFNRGLLAKMGKAVKQ